MCKNFNFSVKKLVLCFKKSHIKRCLSRLKLSGAIAFLRDFNLPYGNNLLYVLLGLFLGLNLGSYFYLFNVLALSTLYVLYNKYIYKINNFSKLFLKILFILFPFLIISLPFLFMAYFAEPDYLKRIGTMQLNWVQKTIVLEHIFL